MAKLMFDRVCYEHGIVKPENMCIELHAVCDCGYCNCYRLRNELTITVKNKNRQKEAIEFIENWKCGKKEHVGTKYMRFK